MSEPEWPIIVYVGSHNGRIVRCANQDGISLMFVVDGASEHYLPRPARLFRRERYGRFMATLLESVPLSRITLGSICSYPQAKRLMELKLGKENAVSALLDCGPARSDDGRPRCSRSAREEVYRYLVECVRRERPDLEIGLCLEDEAMFASLDLQESIGRCNRVL